MLPYDSQRITQFLRHLTSADAILGSSTYIDVCPEEVNFGLVWEGVPEVSFTQFDYDYLEEYVLCDVDVRFDSVDARLQVHFVDELSYQVNLHFNCDIVIHTETKDYWSDKIEKIAMVFFKELNPIYGCVGIERTACGIRALESKQCLPYADKIFLHDRLFLDKSDIYHALLENVENVISIDGVGFYMRKTDALDFDLQESVDDQVLVSGLFQNI